MSMFRILRLERFFLLRFRPAGRSPFGEFDPATTTHIFKIGITDHAGQVLLPAVLQALLQRAPHARASIAIIPNRQTDLAELDAGRYDVSGAPRQDVRRQDPHLRDPARLPPTTTSRWRGTLGRIWRPRLSGSRNWSWSARRRPGDDRRGGRARPGKRPLRQSPLASVVALSLAAGANGARYAPSPALPLRSQTSGAERKSAQILISHFPARFGGLTDGRVHDVAGIRKADLQPRRC